MIKKITSILLLVCLSFSLLFSSFTVEAGVVSKGIKIVAVKKLLPHVVKNYDKKVGGHAETVVFNYIKKNPKSKQEIFKTIDKFVLKNPNYSKNATLFKDKLSTITPNLAQKGMHIPKNGKWSGDLGNSKFWPNSAHKDSELSTLQKLVGKDGIPFKNGYPNFEKFRTHNIPVKNMTGAQSDNNLAIDALIKNGNFKNRKEVLDFVNKNDLIFHHEPDGKSMSLVKRIVHDNVRHQGGASFLRNSGGN